MGSSRELSQHLVSGTLSASDAQQHIEENQRKS